MPGRSHALAGQVRTNLPLGEAASSSKPNASFKRLSDCPTGVPSASPNSRWRVASHRPGSATRTGAFSSLETLDPGALPELSRALGSEASVFGAEERGPEPGVRFPLGVDLKSANCDSTVTRTQVPPRVSPSTPTITSRTHQFEGTGGGKRRRTSVLPAESSLERLLGSMGVQSIVCGGAGTTQETEQRNHPQ